VAGVGVPITEIAIGLLTIAGFYTQTAAIGGSCPPLKPKKAVEAGARSTRSQPELTPKQQQGSLFDLSRDHL
jgi:hypothetical protein